MEGRWFQSHWAESFPLTRSFSALWPEFEIHEEVTLVLFTHQWSVSREPQEPFSFNHTALVLQCSKWFCFWRHVEGDLPDGITSGRVKFIPPHLHQVASPHQTPFPWKPFRPSPGLPPGETSNCLRCDRKLGAAFADFGLSKPIALCRNRRRHRLGICSTLRLSIRLIGHLRRFSSHFERACESSPTKTDSTPSQFFWGEPTFQVRFDVLHEFPEFPRFVLAACVTLSNSRFLLHFIWANT